MVIQRRRRWTEAVVGVGDEIANLETYVDVSPYVLEAPFYYRTVKYPSPGIKEVR
jgi:hypothetical protein